MENNWIKQIKHVNKKVYSQGNQDGIIQYIFDNIGTTNKFCIEFGFNSSILTGGSGPNVARLVVEDKWECLLLDGNNKNESINLHKEFLTVENIGDVFKKYAVPTEPDYISIDVDGIDLWLMKSLLMNGYRPRLISVEYNANFPINCSYTVKPDFNFYIGDMIYGASLLALYKAAEEFNYRLVAANEYDLFLIRNDLISCSVPTIAEFDKFTSKPRHQKTTKERLNYLVEYPSLNPISNDVIEKMKHIFRIK